MTELREPFNQHQPVRTRFGTAFLLGLRDALPLLGGYIPVAISFGLIASQSGFSAWGAVAISLLIYAGASQFLFVGMVAAGAPLWLVTAMALLINARHVVYAPNLASYLGQSRWWPLLMHGLTDQIFALAHQRLPELPEQQRMGWYVGAALLAWMSWVVGTGVGAVVGQELIEAWPLLYESMPFALAALFLVLLAPRFTDRRWAIALVLATGMALSLTWFGFSNTAVPVAACLGAVTYVVLLKTLPSKEVAGCP